MTNHKLLRDTLIRTGIAVRDKVYNSLQTQSAGKRSAVYREGADDTIYQIDKDVEEIIIPVIQSSAEAVGGILLVAEGLTEDGEQVFPEGYSRDDTAVKIIMDPIDGTREIMYDKRSAFYLAAAAPNKAGATLRDIEVAVMVELPTSRHYLSDTLWAARNRGAGRATRNLLTGETTQQALSPSCSNTIYQGFGQIARFFPPGRNILAAIEEELIDTIFPDYASGRAPVFEDQYLSSGGQLYELLAGHDRYVADIRASLYHSQNFKDKKTGHTCHPYDVCATLIGEEAGIIITDIQGKSLDCPLDTVSDVDWIGYANEDIRRQVEPALQSILRKYGVIG